jgi:hypothetical protein
MISRKENITQRACIFVGVERSIERFSLERVEDTRIVEDTVTISEPILCDFAALARHYDVTPTSG